MVNVCAGIKSIITNESKIYIGDMPDTPDNLVVLYATGGYDEEVQLNKNCTSRDTFQVRVRDVSYTSGISRCAAIRNTLHTLTNTLIDGVFYVEIFLIGGINLLGKDSRNRWEFTLNFKTRNVV